MGTELSVHLDSILLKFEMGLLDKHNICRLQEGEGSFEVNGRTVGYYSPLMMSFVILGGYSTLLFDVVVDNGFFFVCFDRLSSVCVSQCINTDTRTVKAINNLASWRRMYAVHIAEPNVVLYFRQTACDLIFCIVF